MPDQAENPIPDIPTVPEPVMELPTTVQPLPPQEAVQATGIPESVQQLKKIEQKKGLPPPATKEPATTKETHPGEGRKLFNFIPWSGRAGMVFKILFAAFGSILALLLLLALLTLTSIDTRFIKLQLAGLVTDSSGVPIANATVSLTDGPSSSTDSSGQFTLTGLDIRLYEVSIEANGYETLEQDVALTRGFLSYSNYRQFSLKMSGIGSLKGKFVALDNSNYHFIDDRIQLGDQEYRINPDGAFDIKDLKTGKVSFTFTSSSYRDERQSFQLNAGENVLPDVMLIPAGDIVANAISWIREDIVSNVTITVEGVDSSFISVASDGKIRVRDLEIGKAYKLRSEFPGYETRDYDVTIVQGDNQLTTFVLVEKGFMPFLRKVTGEGGLALQLFIANFDGQNEKQLTTGDTQPYGEYIEGNKVYFMSTRDNIENMLGGTAVLVYTASTENGNPQRVTSDITDFGRIIPNLRAGKLANVKTPSTESYTERALEVMGLEGSNRKQIEDIPKGTFTDVQISDDGNVIWYYMQNTEGTINGLYRSSTTDSTGHGEKIFDMPDLQIFTVSSNGDKVIYGTTNLTTGLPDLHLYSYSTRQDTILKSSFTGAQYQFLKGNDGLVLFHDYREGGDNLYMLDLSNNTETRLTTFRTTEGIDAIYQQAGFVIYQTNHGMYVIDPLKPRAGKLITTDFARYTGYDF